VKFEETNDFFDLLFYYESCSSKFVAGVAGWGFSYMISLTD